MMISSHTRTLLARIGVLAVVAFAALALASTSMDAAGAASSGGVGTSGTESDDVTDPPDTTAPADDKFSRLWERTTGRDKRWARSTAECESGRDPRAIGGGGIYRGAFQFMKSTWRRSPKSPGGDPVDHPYRTQAVVAVALKNREGAGHWPVCG
jgi:hypothetical protein